MEILTKSGAIKHIKKIIIIDENNQESTIDFEQDPLQMKLELTDSDHGFGTIKGESEGFQFNEIPTITKHITCCFCENNIQVELLASEDLWDVCNRCGAYYYSSTSDDLLDLTEKFSFLNEDVVQVLKDERKVKIANDVDGLEFVIWVIPITDENLRKIFIRQDRLLPLKKRWRGHRLNIVELNNLKRAKDRVKTHIDNMELYWVLYNILHKKLEYEFEE